MVVRSSQKRSVAKLKRKTQVRFSCNLNMFTFSVSYILYLLLFVTICSVSGAGLEEGDQCSFNDGTQGICKFISACPSAQEGLQRGKFPEICGFVGTKSIVCCKETGPVINPVPVTTKPTPVPTKATAATPQQTPTPKPTVTISNRTPGEISKQKCKEYAQYAYERIKSPTLFIIPQTSNVLECAFEKLELIVGGTLAKRFEFPHMALIGYQTGDDVQWACGGSLISENFVLTAGHCLKSRELGSAKFIRIGLTNQSDPTNMQQRTVSQIIAYPKYISTKYHDIGLLKVSENFDFNPYARPACLQTENYIPYRRAIASGWGKIEFSGEGSNDLLKVVLEFFDIDKCNRTYRRDIIAPGSNLKDGIIEDLMICAGSKTELKDTCQGDSGGPLQVYHNTTKDVQCMYDIVGVTSFGKSCGLASNVPGVYTRVSAYIKWIEDTVWP